jgi:hypothetical protein
MIQIDDAGWGCLVGGVVIGCCRVETGECAAGLVPPTYFQDNDPDEPGHFRRKDYLHAAAHVVEVCLAQLKATPAEPIAICSGYVLNGVRAWLTAQGYRWQADKITGPLQELVERAFQAHLAELGFNVGFDRQTDHTKAGLFWWRQVQWLKGGNVNAEVPDPDRVQVCKTGWSTYHTWAYHPYAEARALAGRAKRARLTNHQLAGGN